MTLLEEWRPARELDRFRREVDDLMDRFMGDFRWWRRSELATMAPHIESFVEEGKLIVRADLPGIDPKDVEVTVSDDTLIIRGKREEKFEEKKRQFIRKEVRYGSFERALELPEGVKPESIKATYHDGVLELTAPIPKELESKEVKIQVEPKKVETREKINK